MISKTKIQITFSCEELGGSLETFDPKSIVQILKICGDTTEARFLDDRWAADRTARLPISVIETEAR
ncbi:MAG: hypothetical protein WAS73_01520 [Defluviicoccus sp.]